MGQLCMVNNTWHICTGDLELRFSDWENVKFNPFLLLVSEMAILASIEAIFI